MTNGQKNMTSTSVGCGKLVRKAYGNGMVDFFCGDPLMDQILCPSCASKLHSENAALQKRVEEESHKFQAETLRTSDLSALVRELVMCVGDDHNPPFDRECPRCQLVARAQELLATPINMAYDSLLQRAEAFKGYAVHKSGCRHWCHSFCDCGLDLILKEKN